MTDEYSTAYQLITSYLPQILLIVFFPSLLLGQAIRLMRNPAR